MIDRQTDIVTYKKITPRTSNIFVLVQRQLGNISHISAADRMNKERPVVTYELKLLKE